MTNDHESYLLFRAEDRPFQRYKAPAQKFQVCVICCKAILPGEIIFDVNDQEVAHDSCDEPGE